jgi:hypothetical protein
MSRVVIQGDASGTGDFTIAAPNSNTDRTLTLPDEAGTVLTTAGVPSSAMPAGSVLQVVQGTYDTSTSTSGTTYIDSGITASITPIAATSKILISTGIFFYLSGGGADNGCLFRIVRDATTVFTHGSNSIYFYASTTSTEFLSTYPLLYLDSPSTTSATTYKIQMAAANGSTITAQSGGQKSVIVLTEIAG